MRRFFCAGADGGASGDDGGTSDGGRGDGGGGGPPPGSGFAPQGVGGNGGTGHGALKRTDVAHTSDGQVVAAP